MIERGWSALLSKSFAFVLNILAFIFIGLQLRPILEGLEPAGRGRYFAVAGAVLVTVSVVRLAWHVSFNAVVRWRQNLRGFNPPRPMLRPSVGSGLISSWAGMRGTVTLAAATALPPSFPFRDLIVLTAFSVVLGTVLQGLTLKPLLRAVDLHDDDPVGRELAAARERALLAGLQTMEHEQSPLADAMRRELKMHLAPGGSDGSISRRSAHDEKRRTALFAACQAILAMRAQDQIGDDAFHLIEEELIGWKWRLDVKRIRCCWIR
jgi:NhaP-type Na+/H+ or K+/H+ antiporter